MTWPHYISKPSSSVTQLVWPCYSVTACVTGDVIAEVFYYIFLVSLAFVSMATSSFDKPSFAVFCSATNDAPHSFYLHLFADGHRQNDAVYLIEPVKLITVQSKSHRNLITGDKQLRHYVAFIVIESD